MLISMWSLVLLWALSFVSFVIIASKDNHSNREFVVMVLSGIGVIVGASVTIHSVMSNVCGEIPQGHEMVIDTLKNGRMLFEIVRP